jgi:hypothetical protein
MSEKKAEVGKETVAEIDAAGALGYAHTMGAAVAVFYQAMVDGGMPEHLIDQAVYSYLASRFAPTDVYVIDVDEDE